MPKEMVDPCKVSSWDESIRPGLDSDFTWVSGQAPFHYRSKGAQTSTSGTALNELEVRDHKRLGVELKGRYLPQLAVKRGDRILSVAISDAFRIMASQCIYDVGR